MKRPGSSTPRGLAARHLGGSIMVDSIFGLTFSSAGEAELAQTIAGEEVPSGEGPLVVATANLDHVVNMSRSAEFKTAYRRAWVITADGMPVFLYAKLRGLAIPARVTGSDLCRRILGQVVGTRHKLFFIVSSAETADRLRAEMLRRGFTAHTLAFCVPPFGFERDDEYSRELTASIGRHGTTHLFLGLGSPKSEVWTDRFRADLGDCYVLNFGAGLDYFAGTRSRAPKLMQAVGLEWAWRLACEPRRLFRRYLVNSWRFLWVVSLDLSGRGA